VSLFFSIISFIFKKKFLKIVILFLLLSYYLQYSGINHKYFNKYDDLNIRNIGSIVEMIPFNVTGMLLCHLNIVDKLRNKKFYVIGICIIIIYFLLQFGIFTNINGIRYPGIRLNVAGITLFILFYALPIEYIKNIYLVKFILFITNYTGGIYYLHSIFLYYLKKKIIFIKNKTFTGTIIIFKK
jgi:surface polysaccharide O-acyltransferase-like enzyme